jgi:hypothetical protein
MMPNPGYHEHLRQKTAEAVESAYRGDQVKQTRKYKADAAKRRAMTATIGAWLVRLIGGGGGI